MTAALMTDTRDIRGFLFGHEYHAIFSLVSTKTGNRFTYKVARHRTADEPLFFVFVLTGSENTRDYQFLGSVRSVFIRDSHTTPGPGSYWSYEHSRKSNIEEDAPSVAAFDFLVRRIRFADPLDPDRLQFWHSGLCSNCGRLLTDPESIAAGMGPKCRRKITGEQA